MNNCHLSVAKFAVHASTVEPSEHIHYGVVA